MLRSSLIGNLSALVYGPTVRSTIPRVMIHIANDQHVLPDTLKRFHLAIYIHTRYRTPSMSVRKAGRASTNNDKRSKHLPTIKYTTRLVLLVYRHADYNDKKKRSSSLL